MVVTYHKINQYAESAGAQGRLVPELALWLPFLAFVALISWMYHVIAHRPGGQPIGVLEAAFAKVGKLVRRLIPSRRRVVRPA
jgi:lipopolysaccharide export system permease protein